MIFTTTLAARKNTGFTNIGSTILSDTVTFNIVGLEDGRTWQWFIKANTTDADIDAIAGDTGTVDQGTEAITFSLPSANYTVGNTYYFALREFDGSESQEVIQVAFSIAQNAVLGQGTTSVNINPLFLPNFTTAERDAYTTGSNALLIYNTTTDQIEQYNPDTDNWGAFSGGGGISLDTDQDYVDNNLPKIVNSYFDNSVQRLPVSFTQFIPNGSFEWWNTGNTIPKGWTVQNATAARSTDTSTGTYSCQLTTNAFNDELFTSFPSDAGVYYTYTIAVKLVSGTGQVGLIAQENGGDFTEYANRTLSLTSDFQILALTFQKPDDGTNSVRIKIAQTDATATDTVIIVDEVMVQESNGLATAYLPLAIDDATADQVIYAPKTFDKTVTLNANIVIPNLPTSSVGLPSGALWNDSGTVKVA
jgi:hypothetical protein